MWDTNNDHDAHRFDKLSDFARAVASAERSGRGFRLAYCGEPSPDAFELWSKIYWAVLDGNKLTYGLIEEYSDCCRGAGLLSQKNDFYHRRMWTQSRKYGGILHATSQRPQLISKDALGNSGIIWGSYMDTAAAKRVAAEMNIRAEDLMGCKKGEFFRREIGQEAQKIKVFTPLE